MRGPTGATSNAVASTVAQGQWRDRPRRPGCRAQGVNVMGHVFSGAFPILPGKSDRVRNFEREFEPHREEWDRLSREGTFRMYNVTLQSGPQGDMAIYAMEVADPSRIRTGFTDSPHDRWWVGYFLDVHGLDLSVTPGAPPPTIFTWLAE